MDISFCGDNLKLNKLVLHVGHILSADLSDDEDIVAKRKDICRKANCMYIYAEHFLQLQSSYKN